MKRFKKSTEEKYEYTAFIVWRNGEEVCKTDSYEEACEEYRKALVDVEVNEIVNLMNYKPTTRMLKSNHPELCPWFTPYGEEA